MGRMTNWLKGQASLQTHRKPENPADKAYTFRLTPGQFDELCQEYDGCVVHTVTTELGVHDVEVIEFHGRATGNNVVLCARDDLFYETEHETGVTLVSAANSVTSVPDNMGCCEIVSVGELVDIVSVGDVAFIDFFDVKQGYVINNEELYIAGSEAFKALYNPVTQQIIPLANYVITKQRKDRFKTGLMGESGLHIPQFKLTDGVISGRTSDGTEALHTLYEEVVAIGPLTKRALPGQMTRLEKRVLDLVTLYDACEYDELGVEEADAINALRQERENGRDPDFAPGDLVGICKEIATPIRVRGDVCHITPYDNCLAVIDDAAIKQRARQKSSLIQGV